LALAVAITLWQPGCWPNFEQLVVIVTAARAMGLNQGCPTGGLWAGSGPPAIFVWPPQRYSKLQIFVYQIC